VAHDFNNLLAIILGNAELQEREPNALGRHASMRQIIDACKHGSQLTSSLLSFARQSDLHTAVLDVNDVVGRSHELVERVLPDNISVERRFHPTLPPVLTDASFLESALLNLCINARDAMPGGGELLIETDSMSVSPGATDTEITKLNLAPGDYVTISVADSGIGIEEENLVRVAEPFFSTKEPENGSGLGLATVEGFARQCGGAMHIESRRHEGTVVTLYLPAHEGNVTPAETDQHCMVPASEERSVLVVDDNAPLRHLLARSLSQSGYRVASASSGDDALREFAARAEEFDVLLTDIVMPGTIQGPELARQLKARHPGLRTIVLSGSPVDTHLGDRDLQASDRVLMKPVSHTKLLAAIAELLSTDV
jgi:CheY-like chemotaxis protein